MSTVMQSSGSALAESKSAKKRKAKGETNGGTLSPATSQTKQNTTPSEQAAESSHDGQNESPYIKEVNKNIRNIHKKLAACSKTETIIDANPGASLDELVASKKINADQKAQVLKKPSLQVQLAQLEEQANNYRSFGQEYEERFAKEKSSLVTAHEEDIARAKEEATVEAHKNVSKKHDMDLLVLSQFLHAAAAKRQSDDADSEEGRAFEGVLLLVYQGNQASLAALKNLVDGTDEKVADTSGDLLDFTYAQVKQSAMQNAPSLDDLEEDEVEPGHSSGTIAADEPVGSDPTIAHAGLTELEDTAPMQNTTNGTSEVEAIAGPEQASVGNGANAVAESNWDAQASILTTGSNAGDGWVEVPRDPAETDTGLANTPAAMHGSSNWAEEVTEGVAAEEKAAAENDGFEQVVGPKQGRGRGRGRGEFRGRGGDRGGRGGRGRGDGERGRGGRGRGRGEGGFRGGRGRGGNERSAATVETGNSGGW